MARSFSPAFMNASSKKAYNTYKKYSDITPKDILDKAKYHVINKSSKFSTKFPTFKGAGAMAKAF